MASFYSGNIFIGLGVGWTGWGGGCWEDAEGGLVCCLRRNQLDAAAARLCSDR